MLLRAVAQQDVLYTTGPPHSSQFIIEEKKKQSSEHQLPHYHSLYNDAKVRQGRLQQRDAELFQERCPFRPKIDEISAQIVHGTSFAERLQKYTSDRVQSRERSALRDESDSQLFKPKTGRPPEQRSGDPFMSLYEHSIAKAQRQAQRLEEVHEQQSQLTTQQANPLSSKMVSSATL